MGMPRWVINCAGTRHVKRPCMFWVMPSGHVECGATATSNGGVELNRNPYHTTISGQSQCRCMVTEVLSFSPTDSTLEDRV